MQHERIVDSVDVAAVWPISAQIAPVPIPDAKSEGTRPAAAPAPATLAQMLIVPITLVTFGVIGMGIAAAVIF
ncbi:hypothetical protein [Sphingomonas sp.]|jgi:hypothetical protein|uniref:hypothetical protein n=1 Tax=Sphingomonas sp. TaxID=28214 RepID=UPI002DB59738|nr:hypothetical protein [Sphingomonas sp.]HEU4970028.1 hypothetical protein [Sphingomonas sp.]